MTRPEQAQEVDRNFDAFQRNLAAYLHLHRGQYALMKSCEVVNFFERVGEAYREGLQRFPDRIFSIQEVTDQPIDLGFWSHV